MKRTLTILGHYLLTKYFRKFNNREQLLNWQNQQVKTFLKEIVPQSEFYQDYYQGLEIQDWQNFPILDKAIMMANFDRLNTAKIAADEAFNIALKAEQTRDFSPNLRGYTVGLSTGTSGNRGLFLVSSQEQWIWAGTILAKVLPKFILVTQKIAFFLRANSRLYETVKSRRLQFQFFDLLEPVTNHLNRLNEYQPTILIAPASMLRLLAEAQEQGKLKILPKKVISVAEVLDELDQDYISRVFINNQGSISGERSLASLPYAQNDLKEKPIKNQVLHQVYQCTEGFLGYTCDYGTLHLNEDGVVIQKEYLDQEKSRFIPIITDFRRTTQPIIRYRLNDILVERKTPCPCGSVLMAIERIEGRQDDIFYLLSPGSPQPSLKKGEDIFFKETSDLIPIFPDFISRAIVMASPEIEDYQVMQISLNRIEIALKVGNGEQKTVEAAVLRSLSSLFNRLHCQIPELVFMDAFPQIPPGQKRRRIWRRWTV